MAGGEELECGSEKVRRFAEDYRLGPAGLRQIATRVDPSAIEDFATEADDFALTQDNDCGQGFARPSPAGAGARLHGLAGLLSSLGFPRSVSASSVAQAASARS